MWRVDDTVLMHVAGGRYLDSCLYVQCRVYEYVCAVNINLISSDPPTLVHNLHG